MFAATASWGSFWGVRCTKRNFSTGRDAQRANTKPLDAPTPRLDLGQSQHRAVHVPEGAQFCHALSRCTLQTKPQQAPGQRTRPSLAQAWSLPILPLSSSAHQLQPHFFLSHITLPPRPLLGGRQSLPLKLHRFSARLLPSYPSVCWGCVVGTLFGKTLTWICAGILHSQEFPVVASPSSRVNFDSCIFKEETSEPCVFLAGIKVCVALVSVLCHAPCPFAVFGSVLHAC